MNWDAVGAIGEIVGAFGVIVTLGYLAVQVRENSRQVRSNSVVAINHLINAGSAAIYTSERDQHIYLTGNSRPEDLTEEELKIYFMYVVRLINSFATAITQHRNGVLEADDFERYKNALKLTITQPGYRLWYEQMGQVVLDQKMKDFLESMLADAPDGDT